MDRRRFLMRTIGVLAAPSVVRGDVTCFPGPFGQLCRAEVDFASFHQFAYQNQQKSQWCWAACISMVFSYFGHPVSQERIVREVYGSDVNMPALAGITMARQLNRPWTDDRGQRFVCRLTGAYDAMAGVHALSNAQVVNELSQRRPIVVGTGGHAVVLTAIEYAPTPMGPNVVAGGAFDPWPGRGARGLMPMELTPAHLGGALQFVATIAI